MPILFFAGALSCSSAMAQDDEPPKKVADDVLTPYVSYGVYYDSNLLRQPDSVEQSGVPVSDRWSRAVGGLRVDKEIGQQRLTADLSANHSEYDRFKQYDNDGKDLLANWKWGVGNHLSGNVGTSYSQGLTPFEYFNLLERSIQTEQKNYVDMGWLIHPSWKLNAGYSRYDLHYDLASERPAERTTNTTSVGFDYLPGSGNKVGIVFNHIDGEYPNLTLNSYGQDEMKAKIDWQVTGKTFVQFLGGWAKREYASNPGRDSSVPSARLTAYWMATGKTGVLLSVWRELGATDDLAANYAINQGVSLGGNWAATSKINVNALLTSQKYDYNGVGIIEGVTPLNRTDNYQKAMLGLTYQATQHLKISTSIYQAKLSSSIATYSYRTNGVQVTTRYEF